VCDAAAGEFAPANRSSSTSIDKGILMKSTLALLFASPAAIAKLQARGRQLACLVVLAAIVAACLALDVHDSSLLATHGCLS
jgi:hypothetical protein